jgi:hypothetical protein
MSIRLSEITGDIVIGSGSRFTIGSNGKPTINGRANWVGSIPSTGQAHIVDRGSNANGEWVRFADGTQICYGTSTTRVTTSTAFGNIFRSSGAAATFPAVFSAVPSVAPIAGNSTANVCWAGIDSASSTTATGLIYILAAASDGEAARQYIAIGRWW